MEFYVKCKNQNGIVNPTPVKVETCINPGPDLTPPRITRAEPPSGSYVKYNTTSQDLIIYVNEPSNCKWSKNSNKGYSDMENEFECQTAISNFTRYGLACDTSLTEISEDSVFYIACQDISENKNTMQTPTEYLLSVSTII